MEVGKLDNIMVNNGEPAYPCNGEGLEGRAPQPACPHHRYRSR